MGVESDHFLRIVNTLPGVESARRKDCTSYNVHGKRFGYHWPRTRTVGLKQQLHEQLALVSERPEVFRGAVHLEWLRLGRRPSSWYRRDELGELVYEAWRLSAPNALVQERPRPESIRGTQQARRDAPCLRA